MKETRVISILFVLLLSWLIPSLTTTPSLALAATQERASLLTHLSPRAPITPTVAGTITEFPLPTPNAGPFGITSGCTRLLRVKIDNEQHVRPKKNRFQTYLK